MSNERVYFHWADYVVFSVTLVISLGVGLIQAFIGDRQRTTKEYLMGNRQLHLIPVALSMFMSYISAILVLGMTAEMHLHGIELWMQSIGSCLAFLIAAYIFVPLFYPLKIISSNQYLLMRFDSFATVVTADILRLLNQLFYMGLAMYAPATALEAATGFPLWASIVCTGVVATLYTTVGGMKAVVWTDAVQAVIFFSGLIIVLIGAMVEAGGMAKVWEQADKTGRINFFNWNPDPTQRLNIYMLILGRTVVSLASHGTNQNNVQRFSALPTQRKAKLAMLMNIPLLLLVYTLVCFLGLAMWAYYDQKQCDPLRAGYVTSSNQMLPYFTVNVLNQPGIPGLLVAVLFSGALSSVSSSLNGCSAMVWKDLLEKHCSKLAEIQKTMITKGLSFFFGAVGILLAFMFQFFTGHVMELSQSVLGSFSSPMTAMLTLGAFVPCANWIGAITGGVSGCAVGIWLNIGRQVSKPHREHLYNSVANCTYFPSGTPLPVPTDPPDVFPVYHISYQLFSLIAFFVAFFVGVLVSYATGPTKPSSVDPRLSLHMGELVFCCCPSKVQDCCTCGVRFSERQYDDQGVVIVNHAGDEVTEDPVYEDVKENDVKQPMTIYVSSGQEVKKRNVSSNQTTGSSPNGVLVREHVTVVERASSTYL